MKREFTLVGTNTLLMANGRMADPLDENVLKYTIHTAAKPNIRSKAVKENLQLHYDWLQEERRIQFFGLLYWDAALGFHIPSDNILYMIREAFFGYGSTAKGGDRLLSILRTDREAYPLYFTGPDTPEDRWKAGLYRTSQVANRALGGAKVRVLQPLFKNWSLTFTVGWTADAEQPGILGKGRDFNAEILTNMLTMQGKTFGLGAYRKSGNFGNFTFR